MPQERLILLQSISGRVILAFLGVKACIHLVSNEVLSHVLVAVLLLTLASLSTGLSLTQRLRDSLRGGPDLQDGVCFGFLALPLALNLIFLPHEWHQTSQIWKQWILSISGLCSIVLAPVAEEVFFRGWLLSRQIEKCQGEFRQNAFEIGKACYLNALVFWVMHFPIDLHLWKNAFLRGHIPISPGPFLLGLATACLTLRSGHLRAAIIFHAIANATGPLWWPLLANDFVRSLFYN